MCKADCNCKTTVNGKKPVGFVFASDSSTYTTQIINGVEYYVVPCVMARSKVVMNGALIPEEEMDAMAWNGVPVVVDHPSENGEFASARQPHILSKYGVGYVFDAKVKDGDLVANLWLDVNLMKQKCSTGYSKILSRKPLDVSTGFYSYADKVQGDVNGVEYSHKIRDITPDHLAILLEVPGACSWSDGCGVRANKLIIKGKASTMAKVANQFSLAQLATALGKVLNSNEDVSGGKPADELLEAMNALGVEVGESDVEHLNGMSPDFLKLLTSAFKAVQEAKDDAPPEDQKTVANANTKSVVKPKKTTANSNNEGDEGDEEPDNAEIKKQLKAQRDQVVGALLTNSTLSKEELQALPLDVLQKVAALTGKGDYSGRKTPSQNNDDEAVSAMSTGGVMEAFAALNKQS